MKSNSKHLGKQGSRALTALLLAASLLAALPLSAITWGEPDGNGHPNVGAFVVNHPVWGKFVGCSGVLIHERIVLTAGHCNAALELLLSQGEVTLEDVYVTFNPDPFVEEDWRSLASYSTQFTPTGGVTSHDIGAVILKEPVEGIEPAALTSAGFFDNQKLNDLRRAEFVAVGYGACLEFPPPVVDPSEAHRRFSTPQFLSVLGNYTIMQQNIKADNSGVCYGDSGGALFGVNPSTGAETLVAITSRGQPQCISYSIFYRLDTAAAQAFIAGVFDSLP